jgi:predicted nucleic acid-binding protein
MVIVFVDTNIVIDYIKNRDNEELVAYVDSFDTVYVNDVVIMELYQGARDKKELNFIKKKI